jgi:hypothetical protein
MCSILLLFEVGVVLFSSDIAEKRSRRIPVQISHRYLIGTLIAYQMIRDAV